MDISDNFENDLFEDEDEDEEISGEDSTTDTTPGFMLREQDRFLPICNIIKIMKTAVPENGKIAKDARECIQECVSEFISFITSEAIDRSHSENRKTVNGDDLIYAFSALGFDNYVEPLNVYLTKYRETIRPERNIIYQDGIFSDSSSQDESNKIQQNFGLDSNQQQSFEMIDNTNSRQSLGDSSSTSIFFQNNIKKFGV